MLLIQYKQLYIYHFLPFPAYGIFRDKILNLFRAGTGATQIVQRPECGGGKDLIIL